MHQTSVFSYAAVPATGVKVLEMPYGKSDLAMDVILPDDPTGLAT
jgi:serine protease inhibitor